MKILKLAFEFLNKPYQEKYNSKAKAYLDKFRKSFEQRTKSEKILCDCLFKVEVSKVQGQHLTRFLGAMEATLIIEGQLEYGQPFEYMQLNGLLGKYTETYASLIVIKSKEFLTLKEVL